MAEVIKHICKRTVVSTTPVRPGKTHTLSCLERLMNPNNHVMIVLYYRTGRAMSPGELTKKMKESLAETLSCFPVMTGRLVKESGEDEDGSSNNNNNNKWMVKCNDAGVRMVEARAKGSVEGWLESVDSDKEKRCLIHWEDMFHKPYFWAPFYMQVTVFEEGGVAIGLSCTHLLADLVSATNFIKAWADISIRGKLMHPPIFHRFSPPRRCRSGPDPKPDLINHYYKDFTMPDCVDSGSPITKYTTMSLAFSDQMVRSCISKARAHGPDPSPFEALAGLIWAAVSRASGLSQGLVGLTMGLDVRRVLGLDQGYFGNCMVYANVNEAAEGTNTNLLAAAAKAIGEVKSKIDRQGVVDLMEWIEENLDPKSKQLQRFRNLVCLNLEHADDHYPISFGEGLEGPICARYYVDSVYEKGSILILPSLHGEGEFSRVVMLTLPEDMLFNLCNDELIMSFSPTILMGAN